MNIPDIATRTIVARYKGYVIRRYDFKRKDTFFDGCAAHGIGLTMTHNTVDRVKSDIDLNHAPHKEEE